MSSGFYISKLSIRGQGLPHAEISFRKGANVVTGASDTGKSYIFSAINYGLGRSQQPKEIDESIGYTELFLEIETFTGGNTYTVYRHLKEDKVIEVKECKLEVFKTSNAPKLTFKKGADLDSAESYSKFLLDLIDLTEKKLLFSKSKGTTKRLSYSNLNELTSISETKIITEDSPFYFSGQNTNKTFEQSLLHLLLTGEDFSNTIPKEDTEKREIQVRGKLEFISYQISKYSQERDELQKKFDEAELKFPYRDLIGRLDKEIGANIEQANRITKDKNKLIEEKQTVTKNINYNNELLNRFNLLKKQYSSDLKRLEFILEAESLSSQLGDAICPICTSKLDENHVLHLKEVANFKESVLEEIKKTLKKTSDLDDAIKRLNQEIPLFEAKVSRIDSQIEILQKELKENFAPKIKELKSDLKHYSELESAKSKIEFIDKQTKAIYEEKGRLEKLLEKKEEQEEVNLLAFSILSELSDKIQDRLSKWNYESLVNVVFDSSFKVFDIVISGKSRRSYGKGKRAVSYSACVLGLMDYCNSKRLPFSRVVILDSPLTTYKGKGAQTNETLLKKEIESLFFRDLATTPSNCQVIIFDNKIPDEEIQPELNTVVFTKDMTGRFGFFPVK